jgi:hypothetical protein
MLWMLLELDKYRDICVWGGERGGHKLSLPCVPLSFLHVICGMNGLLALLFVKLWRCITGYKHQSVYI